MIKYRKEVEQIVNAMHQEYWDINIDVLEKIDNILVNLKEKHD